MTPVIASTTAYRLSGNEKYLDQFTACFKNLRAAMTQDAQGFWGPSASLSARF